MSALKAYAVQEDCENTGGIYFAKHQITALKHGASEYGDGDINGWTARRAPWADQYAPGPCPKLVMIENGWWWECFGCGVIINDQYEAYDENGDTRELSPVEHGTGVYCCEECYLQEQTREARIKAREAEAIEWLALEVLSRYPGVTLTGDHHAFCPTEGGGIRQCMIAFKFPGAQIGPAHYRYNDDGKECGLFVPYGDHDAWREFVTGQTEAKK